MPDARSRSTNFAEIPLASLMLAAAFVGPSGCKTDEGKLGSIGKAYQDWIDSVGQGNEFYCGCLVEAGYYESIEDCYRPPLPPPLSDCIAVVLDDFDDAAEALACELANQDALNDCQSQAGCGGDLYACYYDADGPVFDPCPPIPYAAERAFAEVCYGVHLPDPFTCTDGTQIPETYQCDEEPDCPDGSDELGCPSFTCADATSIPLGQQCNGYPECPDLSDEQDCPGQFTCGDGFGIPLAYQCDGYPDCADESDELGC